MSSIRIKASTFQIAVGNFLSKGAVMVGVREGEPISVDFLKENGFMRKRCPKCGEHFWTAVPDQETCGEAPCVPYSFVGRGLPEKFSVDQAREGFLSFMEKEGHERVNRYPVLAKWRDDLFLTSASIVDFQPYVTSGLIPPPANPLAISQPVIRLNDMDKVGPTMGRHLAIFEMMAHHAFNTPDLEVYWMERTVELFHRYAIEVLGAKKEEITYKEGFWEGGGNAGTDLETMIQGLEVATLVFMDLKASPQGYVKMPNRIVDTGYGLSRVVWLSQGTPSAFEALYGDLVDAFLDLLSLEKPDEELFSRYSALSSMMIEIEKGARKAEIREDMASRLGVDAKWLDDQISKIESAYALLDYTKAISFMLTDGAVPSNVQEGYLIRLLIRRSLRIISSLGADLDLSGLIGMQLDYWGRSFPELLDSRDRTLEIVDLEQKRYSETIKRGTALFSRMARRLKQEGEKLVSRETLIELYDSHGIPPEVTSAIASDLGVGVDLPDNFYELVAARHEAPEPKPTEVSPYVDLVEGFPETELAYYEDPYLLEFGARVVGVLDDAILLDRTAFYPEGGGQPSDVGTLTVRGTRLEVGRAEKVKERILHHVEGHQPLDLNPGDEVLGRIDAEKRLSLMRHHTATHVILASAKEVLGDHIWQWGAQKGMEESRLDVSHYKSISRAELGEVEALANQAVMRNLPVKTFFLPRGEAERKYGFVIYQGGLVPGVTIRIVEVEGLSVQACGGTHVSRTGEVGPIKIWRSKRIQDGVVRLEFSVGLPAVKRMVSYYDELRAISEMLGRPLEQVGEAVKGLVEETKDLRKSLEKERVRSIQSDIGRALSESEAWRGVKLAWVPVDVRDQDTLVRALDGVVSEREDSTVLLIGRATDKKLISFMAGSEATKRGVNAGSILEEVAKGLGGGGGGSERLGRGSVPLSASDEELAGRILGLARERLSGG